MTFPSPPSAPQPSTDLVGRGWSFPLSISPQGGVTLVEGTDEIVSAMRMILGTAPGERVMRPEFGCSIWDLLFEPINSTTLGRMRGAVEEALTRWEPRVTVEDVNPVAGEGDSAEVKIEIRYRVRATNTRHNLVFPFYVIPEEQP
jgi:uncharacterized protein